MVKKEFKSVDISALIENPDNPIIHPQEQIEALAKSMKKYGQYYPIIVDENMNILCGHGKKKALEFMGETKADVTIMTGLTQKDKMKLLLEDNKIQSLSFAEYGKIDKIIKSIGEPDIIGFNADYINAIINEGKQEVKEIIDNAGAKLTEAPAMMPDSQRVEQIKPEVAEREDDEYESVTAGMEQARTIICPHCGKEIVL